MKMSKKFIISILTFALLTAMAVTPITAEQAVNNIPPYLSCTGTVAAITEYADRTIYSLEKDGQPVANITVDSSTYIEGSQDIKKGDVIEAFYDTSLPMLMIYPPQMTAVIITVNFPADKSIKVDRFKTDPSYEGYLSSDEMLLINFVKGSELVWQDGTKYNGDVNDCNMAVIYTASTKSIPAKANPEKIILFFPKEQPSVQEYPINGEIIVEGKKIEASKPYNGLNTVMIPLRAVAEALGYNVTWDNETQTVMLNNIITLSIGKDYYTYARTAPITLGVAPTLVQGRTYVPIEFFTDVLRIKNVRVVDGRVLIDNTEPVLIIDEK